MKIAEITELSKFYKKEKAINSISFSVEENSLFCMVGADGAGKSTTLKILAGILNFEKGSVKVFGEDFRNKRKAEKFRDKIAFMPQGLGQNLYHNLSVEENIDFFANLHGLRRKEIADRKNKLLKITGLEKFTERQTSKLSGGMKQKLGICCSLIHLPRLIILDEPTTGVDPISRRELYGLLNEFIENEGLTVIVSTAYIDEAERGSKIAVMHEGEIIFLGSHDDFLKKAPNVYSYSQNDFLQKYSSLESDKYDFIKLGKNSFYYSPKTKNGLIENSNRKNAELEDTILSTIGSRKLNFSFSSSEPTKDKKQICNIENISKRFGDFYALKNITMSVRKAEIFGLLGPNGAGKTTLIKIILGLLNPTEGTFQINAPNSNIKENIGYMSQKFSLYGDLTVYENIYLAGSIRKIPYDKLNKKIDNLMELGNLYNYSGEIVDKLPLGIKQRLALMTSIIHDPVIIFLDEPTSGVDPSERDTFWQLIRYLSYEKNTTAIVTTHFTEESEYCDKISLMSGGRIAGMGSPESLKQKTEKIAGKPYEINTATPFETAEHLKKLNVKTDIFGSKVKFFIKDRSLLPKINYNYKKGEITMDDVFVSITQNEY
ncbi:ABC transporter related protein [Flexistipes sinusarabici DSM 4947]|uniref:ABC transporter related protein n=1 Tax=Flexistipes sinusarabici (strain ATCC 49648 / DSM 4947 / MAS 10) TaxID=717231 RepID=F8E7W6_FLESM|nr:ATP-binding cassette domain-containing protein [Flexistipes sinusarabici]AEI15034.1 ABC transporter related protein [Flexistipes sinusarabici DSM 4947]